MTKTFQWVSVVIKAHERPVLWLQERSENTARVWGSVVNVDGKYRAVIWNPQRTLRLTLDVEMPLKDIKLAIEKYIFDNGIAAKNDIVENHAEDWS